MVTFVLTCKLVPKTCVLVTLIFSLDNRMNVREIVRNIFLNNIIIDILLRILRVTFHVPF